MRKNRIPVKTQPERDPEAVKPTTDTGEASPEAFAAGEPESSARPSAEATAELSRVRAELEEAKDRALRCQAELENYRRRVSREMELERRYAALPLLRDLLPAWDNVHRAIEAAERTGGEPGLLQGFKMVAEQLEDVFRRHECVRIEALYQPFDPNLHEAITQQPSEEHLPGTVVGETQTGFRLHDRIVRPSQVIVSAAAPSGDDDDE